MKRHNTKEYIEETTGMTFQEFLNTVEQLYKNQNIDLNALKNQIIASDGITIALEKIALNTETSEHAEIFGEIEPSAATSEHAEEAEEPTNEEADNTDDLQIIIDQVIHAQKSLNSTTNTYDRADIKQTEDSNPFVRPMLKSSDITQKLDIISSSGNNTLEATKITYSAPESAHEESNQIILNQTDNTVTEPQNIGPAARNDIFFGQQNNIVTGNVLGENGFGIDQDSDGTILNVVGGTFTTDQGGTLTITNNGDFTYTPATGHAGTDTILYTIEDMDGATDTAEITFAITGSSTTTFIDFSTATITGYGGSAQNISDQFSVEDNGNTFVLSRNTWKDILLDYTVTEDTVLEFDFMSSARGEIHGIGFDTNDGISSGLTFKLYGTQSWGISDFNNYAGNEGDFVHYSINVGDFYTGSFNRMFFVMDNDSRTDSNSFFRNITIREPGTDASETVTGTSASQSLFGNGGDDVIYGLGGDDVLYGGSGIDFLFGGDGADTFVFDDATERDHVHDFSNTDGDILDVSALLFGYDPLTDAINDFVQITSDDTNTFVAVDTNGGGDAFVEVAVLHGVTGLASESDLENAGTLITI